MKVKEESEKVGLKFNIQKTKIMASGPTNSWQIDGETEETMTHFILGGFQNHCREGNGNPLQYSCLENSMDRGALMGYSPWGRKVSHTTEQPTQNHCRW